MIRKLTPAQVTFDVVVAVGWFVINAFTGGSGPMAVAFGMAIALALRRLSPTLALSFAWVVSLAQVAVGISPLPANVAILAVLYATSAYGSRTLRWIAFASTFLGAAVITLSLLLPSFGVILGRGATIISGSDALS